jgi:hypothetical protein
MNIPYGIFNITTNKWVKDEDGKDYIAYDYFEARADMDNIRLIDEAGFLSGLKKFKSKLEVREKTILV